MGVWLHLCLCCRSLLLLSLWPALCFVRSKYEMLIKEVPYESHTAPLKMYIQSVFLHFAAQQVNPLGCFLSFHWD